MASDFQSLDRNDQFVLGAGIAAFVASFFPFYGLTVKFAGISGSASIDTWHSFATLGILLVIAATVLAGVQAFATTPLPQMPFTPNALVAGLSALGTLLIILRGVTYTKVSALGGSVGLKWGFYVVMIACLVQVAFAVMKLRASGEQLPG